MPVYLDTHDPDTELTPGTTRSDIVAFLYRNKEFGYRPSEISEGLDIPEGTATTTLIRLHEGGYIGKTEDSYYHALEEREDLRRYVAGLDQMDRMTRELEADPDEHSAGEQTVTDAEAEAELERIEEQIE